MTAKKYNFKILASDIIYKDIDEFAIEQFKKKLAKYKTCPECNKDWNKIRIPKGKSSPLARTFIESPDMIDGGYKIKNIKPICITCLNRLTRESIKRSDIKRQRELKNQKFTKNIVNLGLFGILAFGGYSWFNGFENKGGSIGIWIVLIFMILFILALFNRSSIMDIHDGDPGEG